VDRDRTVGLLIVLFPIFIIGSVAVLCFIRPDVFYDRFVWKYFWGPMVADAGGDARGLTAEYNWVDTLTYGSVLAWAAYLIHRRFKRCDLRMGPGFFLAMTPILIAGPALRVLEDMELFREPLQYVFISPLIYIFLGVATLSMLELARRMEGLREGVKWHGSFLLVALPGILTALVMLAFPDLLNSSFPAWPVLVLSMVFAISYKPLFRKVRYESLLGWTWASIACMVAYAYISWPLDDGWRAAYAQIASGDPGDTHLLSGAIVIGLVVLSTMAVLFALKAVGRRWARIGRMASPVNMLIVAGHMLDASATFIGIDREGYLEKHRLPDLLIESTGTASVMFPLKLAFLLPALYYLDRYQEEDASGNMHLMALVRLTILVLGIGPGTRDVIRMTLGV